MATTVSKVHLLDVGPEEYGDALLCEFGDETILIDGAHPGNYRAKANHEAIQDQIQNLLGHRRISLLIVTHAHEDHIGCLPRLVKDREIEVEWALVADPDIGWGRSNDAAAPPPADTEEEERARALAAALREEPRTRRTSDAEIEEFIDAAASLEDRYREMLTTLKARGTKVVRYGQQSTTAVRNRFANIGLRIFGPSSLQVLRCAELIQDAADSLVGTSRDALRQDSDIVNLYRNLVEVLEQADSRPGAVINMTSVVTRFKVGERKYLFGGDMQFVGPPGDPTIRAEVEKLRNAIRGEAPFAFYKLCHHGSDNAFDQDLFDELEGTKFFGICAGETSGRHPHPDTLRLLKQNDDDIKWARTDRNGQCTFRFGSNVTIKTEEGSVNNSTPNSSDVAGGALVVPPREVPVLAEEIPQPAAAIAEPPARSDDVVEVITRVPHSRTRVTVTIDVAPGGDGGDPRGGGPVRALEPASLQPVDVGRNVRDLLFITSTPMLARNIGQSEASSVIAALRASGAKVLDSLPTAAESSQVSPLVRRELQVGSLRGVVILGGYDVIPPMRLDVLPATLRSRLGVNGDADNFIVWNDEIYGDRDGDGLPELPVSRIPDGRSSALVLSALAAPPPSTKGSGGVRNVARPFADGVYASLPDGRPILVSNPTVFSQPKFTLDTELVYIMLHGDYADGSRFWGEGTSAGLEAVNISNLPPLSGATVFTGCCWGALTVDKPAGRLVPGQTLGIKTPGASIALSFLRRGAKAFVGCTGAHYSPTVAPYGYFGGPMHEAFFAEVRQGTAPAEALFRAKVRYLTDMPHGRTTAVMQAIEFKILRQYTCLGLGW